MAEVVAKRSVLPPCGHRSSVLSRERRRSSAVAFPPSGSFPKVEALRSSSNFCGKSLVVEPRTEKSLRVSASSSPVQIPLSIGKALKWWEKGLQPNTKEVESAQDLVDSLLNAGDKLVIVDFFSPGCAGCRALHPKICQFAEMNSNILFLQVNYEKHKSMCYSLHVHVLPFFRFYRGAQGRVCSFSCTNATIKKFRDALGKHNTDRCSLGPPKGLEEKELLALAANKDLSFQYTKPVPIPIPSEVPENAPVNPMLPVYTAAAMVTKKSEDKALAAAGR